MEKYEKLKKIFKIIVFGFFTIIILSVFVFSFFYFTFPKQMFDNDYSKVILDENEELLRVFTNSKEQWHYPPEYDKDIPEKLIKAAIIFEDKNFYKHSGVDFTSIARAVFQNMRKMKKVSGASTITMQTARLMNPKERNIINKTKEIFTAFVIEVKYTKKDILHFYFTHAPYGGNIVGYKTASLRYFNKNPEHLTWAEASLLAVLPNAPGLMHPGKNKKNLKNKRDNLLKKMYEKKIISEMEYRLSLKEDITDKIYNFDFNAPHFTRRIKDETEDFIVNTTISKSIQKTAEKTAYEYMINMKKKGINNCAVLITDTKTREVKAYVGSNDYWDMENAGMVDGVKAKRSPGSTLKPFLYSLAIDKGIIIPESKIKDVPVYYGTFSPYNADREFNGMVTVKDALTRSLNVPSVNVLDEYGLYDFYEFIKESGADVLEKNHRYYGYSIILGSLEMTLYEMTEMYTSLGNYGLFLPLKELKNQKNEKESKQLISKGSAYLILDILKDLKRPGSEYYWQEFSNQRHISWKTGTSFGRRDAWAIGVTPKYTIGVWVGNFDGKSSYNLTGVESAGTLLFKLFNKIKYEGSEQFKYPYDSLKKISVDKFTGYPTDYIDKTEKIEVDYPVNAAPLKKSQYHKVVYTNNKEEYEVCSICWDNSDKKRKVMIVYPPDVVSYYEKKGIKLYSPLLHNPKCKAIHKEEDFKILYPKNESAIVIPRGLSGEYQKITVKTTFTNGKLYWFVDDFFYKETINKSELSMDIDAGEKIITIINEYGVKQQVKIKIIKPI